MCEKAKKYNRCIITVTDELVSASMPLNEFILYRAWRFEKEKQIVLLLFDKAPDKSVNVPENIELHCIGKNVFKLNKTVKKIVEDCKRDGLEFLFHIHEAKSVILFDMATFGRYKKHIVYTVHSTYKNYPLKNKLLCNIAVRRCDRMVCVGETSYKYFPKKFKQKFKVFAIQNGIDTERTARCGKNAVKSKDKFVMVYVARFVPLKMHFKAIDVAARLENAELHLIGKGPLEEQLKRYADTVAKGKVVFVGALTRDDVYKRLSESDLYISTSSYEGMPLSLLEALSCALPCVVSDIEQHREVLEKCPGDFKVALTIGDFVNAIKEIQNMSEKERKKLGEKCRVDANEHFSVEKMHEKYDAVYGWRE